MSSSHSFKRMASTYLATVVAATVCATPASGAAPHAAADARTASLHSDSSRTLGCPGKRAGYGHYQNIRLRSRNHNGRAGTVRARFNYNKNRTCAFLVSRKYRDRRHPMRMVLCGDVDLRHCTDGIHKDARKRLPRRFYPRSSCVYVRVSIKSPSGRQLVAKRSRVVVLSCE